MESERGFEPRLRDIVIRKGVVYFDKLADVFWSKSTPIYFHIFFRQKQEKNKKVQQGENPLWGSTSVLVLLLNAGRHPKLVDT